MFDTSALDKTKVVLVGYSGGADSVYLYNKLKEEGFDVVIGHVNYAWCESEDQIGQAILKGFPNIKYVKAPQGKKDEWTARNFRREMFKQWCEELETNQMVMGHHMDDNSETLIFRLVRGTSLQGMNGIQYVSDIDNKVKIVRPMLALTKAQIIQECIQQGWTWWEDPANHNLDYARARIRNRVVPELMEISANASKNLIKFAKKTQEVSDYMINLCASKASYHWSIKDNKSFLQVNRKQLMAMQPIEREYFWKYHLRTMTAKTVTNLEHALINQKRTYIRGFIVDANNDWVTLIQNEQQI